MKRFFDCWIKGTDCKRGLKGIKTLTEIKDILKKHEKEFKKRYGIKKIGIFGSYLRGEAGEMSDLLGVKVDLVEKSALKSRIGKHILKEVAYL